jgi:hypothetical protein
MFADTVFITDDYDGISRLWLELLVVEVDTESGERKAAVQAFQSLAAKAGAVFPVMLPYAFAASAVTGVLEKLVAALEQDKNVIKVPFSLYPGKPRPGKAPLQEGAYVAFAHPEDPAEYRLHSNGLLTSGNGPSAVSYAVFDVSPTEEPSPRYVVSQKVATLLTQMKKGNPASAMSTIDFLDDTLTQYSNFRKLERYLELKNKKGARTGEEKALMEHLAGVDALKPFLPKGLRSPR